MPYIISTEPDAEPVTDQLHAIGLTADQNRLNQAQADIDIINELHDSCVIGDGTREQGHRTVLDQLQPHVHRQQPSDVSSPPHYTTGGIETIDYIRAKLGAAGFRAYCLGNVLKYVSRWQHKGGQKDLEKAGTYMQWALETQPERVA